MGVKENKTLLHRVIDLWNSRDMDAFFNILAPEYVEHLPTGDISLEQLKQFAPTFFNAFPDIKITLKDLVAEEDKVAVLVNWTATHKGSYMGIPATGKKIDISVAIIVKIKDSKWVEFWNVTDIRLAQQLGAIPKM